MKDQKRLPKCLGPYMDGKIASTFDEYTEGEKILKLKQGVYGQLKNGDSDFYKSIIKIFLNKTS